MLSEADLIAKRAALRWLAQQHPKWTHQDLADALSMSRSWVSKWLQWLHQADPHDVMVLHSRSRARHIPPASIASQPAVVKRILEIRLEPVLFSVIVTPQLTSHRVGASRHSFPQMVLEIRAKSACSCPHAIESGKSMRRSSLLWKPNG